MRAHEVWLPFLLGVLVASQSRAQGPGVAVQLPTVSTFGVATAVSVPDRGSAYLGGVNRAATGRNEFGVPLLPLPPFRNRGIGTERSVTGAHVSVYIHDLAEMDEYLLSQPTRRFPNGVQPRQSAIAQANGPRPEAAPASGPAAMSVADLQAKQQREQQERAEDGLKFFERGKKAEATGKLNVARIYYQMAARRAGNQLKPQIAARLELIDETRIAQDGR